MRNIILFMIIIFLQPWIHLQAQTAKEVVAKADELMRSKSSYAEFTMEVIKPDWSRKYTMKMWALEPDYALVYVLQPARDKGNVTLKRKNEVWNWVPSINRVIKIPPSMMLQSWMGSDFTNDDLVRQSSIVVDYIHEFAGEDVYEGFDCHKIQLMPKPEAGVVWGKIIMWISKKEYLQLKSEFYDEDGFLVKSMVGSDVGKMDGRLITKHLEMIPVDKPGQKTVMDYLKIDFDIKTNDSFFSQQNMKRVR